LGGPGAPTAPPVLAPLVGIICPSILVLGTFKKSKLKFDNAEIFSIFPIDSLVFYVWYQNFDFLRKTDQFWADILYAYKFFLPNTTKNLSLCS
jgi:hypothetical protein